MSRYRSFSELFEQRITDALNDEFIGVTYDNVTLHKMQSKISDLVQNTFHQSSFVLDRKSISWLTNQYFRKVTISAGSENLTLGDVLYFNDYELSELPISDISLMHSLFKETSFGNKLQTELNRRSQS